MWTQKRVKDTNTGSIMSLQELQDILVGRVLAQVNMLPMRLLPVVPVPFESIPF